MSSTPPAVTTGPPQFPHPVFALPRAARSAYSPRGIFQRYLPVLRSIALSVPQGGFSAGYPSGSRNLPYCTRYFWSIGVLTPCPPLPSGEGELRDVSSTLSR